MENTLKDMQFLILNYTGDKDDLLEDIKEKIKSRLQVIEWKEKYNIDIPVDTDFTRTHFKLSNYYGDLFFSYYNDAKQEHESGKGGKYISWSDDGSQPLNEWCLEITFGTGAYIFGDDYPVNIFQDFFNELKTLNHKFIDSQNHCIYWTLEEAGNVLEKLPEIIKKYVELNKEDFKNRKIKKLEDELNKLKD
jgi:hypothetical protein